MSSIVSMQKKPVKKRGKSLWMKNVLTRTIILPFKSVGGNLSTTDTTTNFLEGSAQLGTPRTRKKKLFFLGFW